MPDYDFSLERRLKEQDSALAKRHACCMSLFEQMLKKFLTVFPTFTDHTLLHTLSVVNLSNQLLQDETEKLSAEEIYIYLMACALHDIGMGTSDKDLEPFIDAAGIRAEIAALPARTKPTVIRKFYNDFSAAFVKKYWEILEIPNRRYAEAIAEVGRGHRKTNLMDEALYPANYDLGDGKRANLAALAALLRLADELDVASDRNPDLLYDTDSMEGMSEKDVFEFSKHEAIHAVAFAGEAVVIYADTEQPEIQKGILEAARTISETLASCSAVLRARSEISLAYKKVKLVLNRNEMTA